MDGRGNQNEPKEWAGGRIGHRRKKTERNRIGKKAALMGPFNAEEDHPVVY